MEDRNIKKNERHLVEQDDLLGCKCEKEWEITNRGSWFMVHDGDIKSEMFRDSIVVFVYVLCDILYWIVEYFLSSIEVDMIG